MANSTAVFLVVLALLATSHSYYVPRLKVSSGFLIFLILLYGNFRRNSCIVERVQFHKVGKQRV